MKTELEFSRKLLLAYNEMCKPICKKLKLSQTAFDILMFLANNPEYKTARDIVEIRKIKANLVSVNVERLVEEGYLKRKAVEGDRRKVHLVCTEKAQPIIEKGQEFQKAFTEKLFENIDEETGKILLEVRNTMEQNLNEILKGGNES